MFRQIMHNVLLGRHYLNNGLTEKVFVNLLICSSSFPLSRSEKGREPLQHYQSEIQVSFLFFDFIVLLLYGSPLLG